MEIRRKLGSDVRNVGVIAFGNWNKISHYDEANRKWIADDDIMPRLGNILEATGRSRSTRD